MERHGEPELFCVVYGDWHTVINAREYRDSLLEQKPFDEDGADYAEYYIKCNNITEMVKAYNEFGGRLKLRCAFGFLCKQEDESGSIVVWMVTDHGYGRKLEPTCSVKVYRNDDKLVDAVRAAVETLGKAIS